LDIGKFSKAEVSAGAANQSEKKLLMWDKKFRQSETMSYLADDQPGAAARLVSDNCLIDNLVKNLINTVSFLASLAFYASASKRGLWESDEEDSIPSR
jgi:hypothetical protein